MSKGTVFDSYFESVPNTLFIPRENEILVRMAEGKGYKVIAEEVGLKEKTARWYMGRINEKLDVNDKTAAVCRAFCLGILKPLCLPGGFTDNYHDWSELELPHPSGKEPAKGGACSSLWSNHS